MKSQPLLRSGEHPRIQCAGFHLTIFHQIHTNYIIYPEKDWLKFSGLHLPVCMGAKHKSDHLNVLASYQTPGVDTVAANVERSSLCSSPHRSVPAFIVKIHEYAREGH
jgi:hypothetical protein